MLIAAPVGPVNIICIQRTLERGFWGGFAAGLGAVLADGLIAAVAAFGITAISGILDAHRQEIQLVGGLIMIAFGVRLYMAKPRLAVPKRTTFTQLRRIVDWVPESLRPALRFQIWRLLPHAGVTTQTFFLTITNPGAILGLFAIVGGLGSVIGGIDSYVEALTLVFSVMAGSLLWWAGLSRLIEKLRGRLTESRLKIINQVAGAVLLAFGGLLFFQLAIGMLGHAAGASTAPPLIPSLIGRQLGLLGNPV
ncbi:LysE family translocator [Rhodomicrobium vannielii]|uniref:LysE family translocator n=1 Tax=Rhodomicrobium vannielii TaxID=1069 RepID=UPI001FD9D39F|nr:LysE family transporter [Rhodomicrobium vannielii]